MLNRPPSLAETVYYGTQYYRAPTPTPRDWEADMQQVAALNLKAVQLRVQWRWHERREGKYKFDDLDRLFDLAQQHGLRVIVKFLLETAPDWIYHKHHGERVDPWGMPIHPHANGAFYVGGWLPCFENPAVRQTASRFVRAVVKRYRDRDALLFWNLWNEPRSRPAGECACEHSNRRYHAWLKERYGTIEQFNDVFGKAWEAFEFVRPPTTTRDYADMFVWRQFMMEMVADRLRWMAGLVRGLDNKRPVMTHVGACSMIQDILCDSSDDWLNAQAVDFYGSSLATMGIHDQQPYLADLNNDWIRAVSPYYWIHELYADWSSWRPRPPPSELRFNVWTSVSRGAKGICFWQFKNERFGNESDGYGLVKIDGTVTDRADEAKRIGERLARRPDVFGHAQPLPAELAIVYDPQSDLISRLEHTTRLNHMVNYNQPLAPDPDYTYKHSLQGAYRACWALDIPVDFVSSHDIEAIRRYKAVYLPCPILLEQRLIPVLRDYVAQGGTLIAESSPGLREENTWVSAVVPGYGLDVLFGVRERNRVLPGTPDELVIAGQAGQMVLPAVVPESSLSTARVLAAWKANGQPAVTANSAGRGQAILIQSYPGRVYHDTPTPANLLFFKWLFGACAGIASPLAIRGNRAGIVTRVLTLDRNRLIMVFNYNKELRELVLQGNHLIEPCLSESLEDLAGDNTAIAGADGLAVTLAPESVGAWLVQAGRAATI